MLQSSRVKDVSRYSASKYRDLSPPMLRSLKDVTAYLVVFEV